MGISTSTDRNGGPERHSSDYRRFRHGRIRDRGLETGQYLQPPPMLFTRDGHNVFLGDCYRGASAFLVCGGPSLTSHDLTALSRRGVLSMAVNNAATVVRPNLWISTDDPGNFADVIWRDPAITKFIPMCHFEKPIFVRDDSGELKASDLLAGDMPAVFGFRRNEAFNASQWLWEDSFNWGNRGDRVDDYGLKGSRSVMYVAIRMLHFLGVRRIYLIGCDFRMHSGGRNYAFEQDRSEHSVRSNNDTYEIMNARFSHLKPYLGEAGLELFNCTPDSGLKVFEYVPFDEAIAAITSAMPMSIDTSGMYDRQQREVTWHWLASFGKLVSEN